MVDRSPYFDKFAGQKKDGYVAVSTKSMLRLGYITGIDAEKLTLVTKGGTVHVALSQITRVAPRQVA